MLCDTEVLATLPPREYRSGLGELAKYHFLGGGDLDALDLDDRVAACVAIKAAVVADDEREGGRRATLNYGHTLAHAIEIAGGHDLRHGEAVAVGLVFAGRAGAPPRPDRRRPRGRAPPGRGRLRPAGHPARRAGQRRAGRP